MSVVAAAIDRNDVANYVDSLFLVYIIMILAWVAISWVVTFRGSLPYNRPLRAVTSFINSSVEPYLNLFRRIIPSVGVGGVGLDLGPIVGLIVLFVLRGVVVALIQT